MKVFISWSGKRSQVVAEALHTWLEDVLQNVDPWMSKRDIGAGARWGQELDDQLETTDFGIICVTPENAHEPWLNYEAGALSKRVSSSRVVPFLIAIDSPGALPQGPLGRFQAKLAPGETLDVVRALNAALGENALPDVKLERAYERWLPDLVKVFTNLPEPDEARAADVPGDAEMLKEILATVRELARDQRQPMYTMFPQIPNAPTGSYGTEVFRSADAAARAEPAIRLFEVPQDGRYTLRELQQIEALLGQNESLKRLGVTEIDVFGGVHDRVAVSYQLAGSRLTILLPGGALAPSPDRANLAAQRLAAEIVLRHTTTREQGPSDSPS